jgi:thiosulfate reductase cytochrome b subunit
MSLLESARPASDASGTVHSYNVRICHWINVIACVYLLWSGIHIFLDFPELYWGHTGYRGFPAAFKLADWGLSWDDAGKLGDRRWGRNYHFTFAWVFLINGLVYVGWNLYTKHFRNQMWPARNELAAAHIRTELRDHLRWRARDTSHGLPRAQSSGSYGSLQKMSYLILIFVYVPLMILTGIAQSPGFTAAMPWLLDLFGGRQSARTLHTIGTVALVLFVVVHLLEIVAAGFFIKVRSMITGKLR